MGGLGLFGSTNAYVESVVPRRKRWIDAIEMVIVSRDGDLEQAVFLLTLRTSTV